jgi:hypothetical protein
LQGWPRFLAPSIIGIYNAEVIDPAKQVWFVTQARKPGLLYNSAFLSDPREVPTKSRVMHSENFVNIFNNYKRENSFTNGLFALLQISVQEQPLFVESFLQELLDISPRRKEAAFSFSTRVLRGIDHADAELSCGDCCLRFETKIWSGDLRHSQAGLRIRELKKCSGRLKRMVFLTPDDAGSTYVKEFFSHYQPTVLHLAWTDVSGFLERSILHRKGTFSELVRQFVSRIKEQILEQDFAGVITKIAFGPRTGVFSKRYLRELPEERCWNTPSGPSRLNRV